MNWQLEHIILYIVSPLLFVGAVLYGLFYGEKREQIHKKYKVRFKLKNGNFKIDNIRI